MIDRQLELHLGSGRNSRLFVPDRRKPKRGHQWFDLMRRVVDADPNNPAPFADTNRTWAGSPTSKGVKIKRPAQPGAKAEKPLFILPL